VTEDRASPEARAAAARMDAIERGITQLVREAPVMDEAVTAKLLAQLRAVGVPLATSIAQVVELVAAGQIAQGIALPHLAMACATLADGVAGRLSERELEAARYEIDTLLPLPGAPAAPDVREPDVPLIALSRGSRRQT
jgi:hypothetical protein